MIRLPLLGVFLLAILSPALGQSRVNCWGPAVSVAVAAAHVVPSAPPAVDCYEWRTDRNADEIYLYRGGRQIGGYSFSREAYFAIDGDQWSAPTSPPVEVPGRPVRHVPGAVVASIPVASAVASPSPASIGQASPASPVEDFGVDLSKLGATRTYRLKGHEITREQAIESIEKGLPDDSGKLHLTFIGSRADRLKAEQDFKTAADMGDIRERVKVCSFAPDDWQLSPGFVKTGNPGIYLQAPSGKVLHRQGDYQGAGDFQAIRKAVADYDAGRDPDRRKVDILPNVFPVTITPKLGAIGLGVIALAALFFVNLNKAKGVS